MFDELHDPNPPAADMHTLASVTGRARRIRRRRAAWMGGSAAALVVVATAGALLGTRDDEDGRQLVNVTAPGNTDTSARTDPPDPTVTTVLTGTPASGLPDDTSRQPSTTAPEPTTTTAPATTTTAVAATPRPIVAIDGNGDAVIVDVSGELTVLYDGPDPDDPPPAEGETIVVDAVAITDDGKVAFVGTCCEPVPGTVLRFTLSDTSTFDSAFGHAPAISPDGTKVVTDVLGTVQVIDLDLTAIAATADDFLGGRAGDGFVWIDDTRFVVLSEGPGITHLQSVVLAADNTLQTGPSWSTSLVDGFATGLAGISDGVMYVSGLSPATLTAFASDTLQPVPASDIVLPGEPLSAWIQGGELRRVDRDRRLHIGDTVIPGEFIWVR